MSNDSLSHAPKRHLLLVINGPFGVGKSTVAAALTRHVRGALVFDAESVGGPDYESPGAGAGAVAALRDSAAWRALVAEAAGALRGRHRGPILMPVTLLDRAHCDDVLGRLVDLGFDVRHVTLHTDKHRLRARVGDDEAVRDGRQSRRHRVEHEQRYEAARPWLHATTLVVDTTATSPDTIAVGLADALLTGALPVHRSATEPEEPEAATEPELAPEPEIGARTEIGSEPAPAAVYRAPQRNSTLPISRFSDVRRRNG